MPGAPAYWRAIDWRQPWLAPLRERGERLGRALQAGKTLVDALNAQIGPEHRLVAGALRFVPQASVPADEAYESFIARSARVPTREGLHDLFNALVWLVYPALKRRLNELHAAEIARDGIADQRGPVRDALTLFDENAAWLQVPQPLAAALRDRDWHAVFVTHRAAWREARPTLFGHALIEKLVTPRKAITAHAWLLPPGVDAPTHLVQTLTPVLLASKPHEPLPVLGVPGWWPANEDGRFYDDVQVFRPARRTLTPR